MTDKRPHKGLALGKQFHDAQKRMFQALETINGDQEATGDLAVATFVDHENRIEALEKELSETRIGLAAARKDFAVLADMVSLAIENPLRMDEEGDCMDFEPFPWGGDATGPQHGKNGVHGGKFFTIADGDLREGPGNE